jgi:hypothetical protein
MNDMTSESTHTHHHRDRDDAAPWVFGGVLIVLGVFMLLRNVTGWSFGNWWALFILIPAIGALAKAWQLYQTYGTVNEQVRGSLIGGIVLTFVFAMFFFGFNWALFWPVILIVIGIGALAGAFARH